MFHKLNLCLGLSLFGLLAVSGAASPAHSPEVSDYDIMMEAFEAAEISHSKALDDAKDKSERRALRKAHPAYTYFQPGRERRGPGPPLADRSYALW